jgi:HEXXH motif-containing protein
LAVRAQHLLPSDVDLPAACRAVRDKRVSPGATAAYFELVPALQTGDRLLAENCWRRIAAMPTVAPGIRREPFDPHVLSEDAARFQRLLAIGWGGQEMFATPEAQEWKAFDQLVGEAFDCLKAIAPAWHDEVLSLVVRVYGALPAVGSARGFSSASSRMVWGALFINLRRNAEPLRVLSAVVHEATHQMLFGLSHQTPLTENPPEERYSSPLRPDARPMDGVYHATYVAARLCLLYHLLRASTEIGPDERARAAERFNVMHEKFTEGLEVVRQHGRLSALGWELMDAAEDGLKAIAA